MEKIMHELSNPQKNIWTMEQFYKGSNINNICGTLTMKEDINLHKLNIAVNKFVQNNKSFGLNFDIKDGQIKQYFVEQEDEDYQKVYLKDYNEVKELAIKISEQVFDIEGKKLYKFVLFKLENGNGGFIVMTHHIISDAATFSLIGTEIVENYAKLLKNEEIDKKDYSYEDYLQDEKNYMNGQKFLKDKEYWNNLYATVPEVASIPSLKKTIGIELSGKAKRKEFIIEKELLKKISDFCTKNRVSNFNFFMAIYAIYLSRVSNLNDFVIGTPVLNRTNFKEKHTTGMFINTEPLRIKIDDDVKFVDFVKNIAQNSLSMLRYQKYPYEMLLENLRKKQSNLPTLYDVMLSYQITKANDRNIEVPYEVEWLPTSTISNGMYIHLHDNNDEESLNIAYDYQVEKYDNQDIEAMHKRILHIISQVLENENCLESDIEIVTPEEKNKILNEFNNTFAAYPKDKSIADLFEEQVEKTPDNIAVVCGEKKLTYRELNEKANSLANLLVEEGVKADSIVGILVDRSIEMIISILATLKSGGAYIPMDPDYPKDRIEYMLEDSNCKVLLSTKTIQEKLNLNAKFVDVKDNNVYKDKKDNLNIKMGQNDLSYMIYTSGSTGKPKGVMLTHKGLRNLVNYCNNYIDYLKNNKYRNIVSVTTVSFDIFFFESIVSLQGGLKLVIANQEEQTIPRLLKDLIKREDIEIIQTTPSRMKLLLENIDSIEEISSLKYITLAGEQYPNSLAEELRKIKGVTLYNGYGPSETTVFSTLTDVTNVKEMTIGKPLDNTQIYILDNNMNVCPIGVSGEIYISGDGVGRGYINKEELTKKSYLKNKFNNNSLIYKTGDLGYYKNDGTIICLGRADNQVKIRGLRIELEEIEKAICDFEEIKNCVVVKKVSKEGHEFLCAYYVKNNDIDEKKIRNELKKKLTNYMVPQYFVELENLPYTPNGKVDRKLLPMPEFRTKKELKMPANAEEVKLKEIFEEIFGTKDISTDDNFFELGGDSLSAIKLATKIYDKLKVQIGIKVIFDNPTIMDLAKLINGLDKSTKIKIKKADKKEYYPLSSAQKRIYYASAMNENSTLYNIAGGLVLDKGIDVERLEKSINRLIEKYGSLRTTFEMIDGQLVQKVHDFENYSLRVSEKSEDNIDVIFKRFVKPFRLLSSKLFDFELVKLKDEKVFLMMNIHHSICDGTSLGILLKEIENLYNNKLSIEDIKKDYIDFAEWENNQIEKEKMDEAEKYWTEIYKEEVPILNLPTTYERENSIDINGESQRFEIKEETKSNIEKMANDLKCTPYMIYLAAYYILLNKYTSQKDIVVGTPITGRYLPELENMVGMFVNTLALRSKLNTNNSFEKYLQDVKTMCLEAYNNQEYPLEELTKKINSQREDSKNKLIDTMFIYQNDGYPEFKLGDVLGKYYIPKSNVAKFDISMEIIPNELQKNCDINVEYNTSLFDNEYVKNFGNHFKNILEKITENNKVKIKEINILTSEEENKIKEFNNTYVEYPKDKNLIRIFEETVKKVPENIAIVFQNKKITYKELNELANEIANSLIEKGIEKDEIIGILLERSIYTVASMLAVLKIGSSYMLIDSNLPNERIEYMLTNSNAKALITEENMKYVKCKNKLFIEKSQNKNNITIIDQDTTSPFSILYTSGSTGNPKGVIVTNKGIVNLLYSYNRILNIDRYQNFLSICSIAFDMFNVEIFLPLVYGKKVILSNEEEHKSPNDINNLIKKYEVDILFITPSKFELLLSTDNKDAIKSLKNIQFGGESFKNYLYSEIKAISENIEIYNEYGPSEITSCCSIKHIKNKNDISIGRPIDNVQIYVVDDNNNICPRNVPGEICVAGEGVSKGYLNQEELTKKTFQKNLFGKGFLYKTGDIGIINSKNELEFIDRKDSQIKIRGLRIELSEIEKQIMKTIKLKNCAVVYKKEKGYISAFICADEQVDISMLRNKLMSKLPIYMVPKYITQISEMPLSITGKINKKLLETVYKDNILDNVDYVEPVTDQEKIFCQIWEKLLNTKIGLENNVFECGADSLLAIRFKTELLAYNIEVSYADLFKYKTVKSFCKNSNIKENDDNEEYDYTNINKVLAKNNIKYIKKTKKQLKNNVLLFGATGFVGMHVVESFIKNDNGKIFCVVRDKNNKSARDRFIEILHYYFEDSLDKYIDKRIIILKANILKSNFELSNRAFNNLVRDIDFVINTAALVKHYGDEMKFIEINVNSTQNIIDFCKENNKKLIHISSLSVSGNSALEGGIEDRLQDESITFIESNLYIGQKLNNSYIKSKFKGERLILENIDNGLQAQILRLGNITNRYFDGKFQINPEENAFANKIKTFIKLGILPEYLLDSYLEFTPVDLCADAIITILQNYNKDISVLHIYNPNHVYIRDFIKYLGKSNVNLVAIEQDEFKRKINDIIKVKDNSEVLLGIVNDFDINKRLSYDSKIKIESKFTRRFLEEIGFVWKEIDEEYIRKYINFLIEIKFL